MNQLRGIKIPLSLVWGVIIVSSAWYVRPLYSFLLNFIGRESMLVLIVLPAFVLFCYTLRQFRKKYLQLSVNDIFSLIISGLILLILFFSLDLPEEKIHILLYGSLGFIRSQESARKHGLLGILLFVFTFSLASELFQAILPDRVCDVRDLLIDTASGLAAAATSRALFK